MLYLGYRLIAVQKQGNVIAASIWGKLKTVTQMIAIILLILDMNSFGAFINTKLAIFPLILNILSTVTMLIAIIATVFSGWDYLKGSKDLLEDDAS